MSSSPWLGAAELLKVSTTTIWRWINAGRLASYRVGPKAVRIKKADLATVIQPARAQPERVSPVRDTMPTYTTLDVPPLTEEQRRRGLAALEEIDALQERMLARRGGRPFPDSVDLIREMREERSRQLDEA